MARRGDFPQHVSAWETCRMSKYQPLADRLSGHAQDTWRPTFAELEEVLGFPLSKTARSSAGWWSNEPDKPHKKAWLDAGWHVEALDRPGEAVTFRRLTPRASAPTIEVMGRPVPKAAVFAGAAAVGAALVATVAGLFLRKRK
jgi:hypothetical protein